MSDPFCEIFIVNFSAPQGFLRLSVLAAALVHSSDNTATAAAEEVIAKGGGIRKWDRLGRKMLHPGPE